MAAVPNAGGGFGPSGEVVRTGAGGPVQTLQNQNRNQQPPNQQGAVPPVNGQGSNQHSTLPPGAVAGDGAQGAPAKPLDKFSDLFSPKVGADGKPEAPAAKKPLFNYDEGKFMEQLGKINFSSNVSPELIAKALGGDTEAFTESLNQVARMVYGYNMQTTMKMVEHAVESQIGALRGEIPNMMQQHQVRSTMQEDPILSHPAVAPMRAALETSFASKFPHASQEQIKQHVNEYLKAFKDTLVGQDKSATGGGTGSLNSVGSEPDDWGKFMDFGTPNS